MTYHSPEEWDRILGLDAPEAEETEIDFAFLRSIRTHGDITTMLTWDFADDARDPCLVLAPTFAPRDGRQVRIVVIRLKDAWLWSRDHNDDTEMEAFARQGVKITGDQWQRACAAYYAVILGFDPNNAGVVRRVRGIIEDAIPDLHIMPPAPERETHETGVIADLTDLATGEVTSVPLRSE
jgi:hypothetical protein